MDNKTLIEIVAGKLGISRLEVTKMTESLCEIVADVVKEGDSITVPSVGAFEPKKRLERVSVHPTSGKRLLIPPKLLVGFKPSSLLRQRVREVGK